MNGGEAMTAGCDPVQVGGSVRPADLRSLVTALADAAVLGDFFTIACGRPGPAWRPAREAYRHGLRDLIGQTERRLGVSQNRVAASIAQLGYAARLWSPALACALRQGIVPDLQRLQIRAELPARLRLSQPRGWHADGLGVLAGLLYHNVVEEHLEPLAAGLDVKIASERSPAGCCGETPPRLWPTLWALSSVPVPVSGNPPGPSPTCCSPPGACAAPGTSPGPAWTSGATAAAFTTACQTAGCAATAPSCPDRGLDPLALRDASNGTASRHRVAGPTPRAHRSGRVHTRSGSGR